MLLLLIEAILFISGLRWFLRKRVVLFGRMLAGSKARIAALMLMSPPVIFVPLGLWVGFQYALENGGRPSPSNELLLLVMRLSLMELTTVIGVMVLFLIMIFSAPRLEADTPAVKIPDHKRVFTVCEAADYLRVTESEILHLIEAGRIPAGRFGDGYRIARDVLDDYLLQAPDADARLA